MFSTKLRTLALVASLLAPAAALAGPVSDFETAMRNAYGDYRAALFQTNAGNAGQAEAAIAAFTGKWSALASAGETPPPQYADDPAFAATMRNVGVIADSAATEVADGKLAEAHETLEAIRDQIGGLHRRNGIIGFSDRMNAYHAAMEEALARDYTGFDAAGLGLLREDAAVLAYLAGDIAANPPAEAASDASYAPLLAAMQASVEALHNAAVAGDAAAARTALAGLKVPYSKLFLKFG